MVADVFGLDREGGKDSYAGTERFVVEEITGPKSFRPSGMSDGQQFEINDTRADAPLRISIWLARSTTSGMGTSGDSEMGGYWKNFSVAPEVLVQARKIGLYSANLEKWIGRMARKSAPLTHPMGNRRYKDFALRTQDGVVVSICRFDPSTGDVATDVIEKIEQADSTG